MFTSSSLEHADAALEGDRQVAFQLAKAVAEQLERATQRYFRYAIQGTGGTQGLYLGET